ncbi:MAG TPA: metallophosphoesterase [Candidatus Binatia bacterium]|nr:metallophosphoesterase [Candidatus Binatia bacterium]
MSDRGRLADHLFFHQYFTLLALAGGVGEWSLLCWLMAPLGWRPPLPAHLLGPLALAAGIRVAAFVFRRDEAAPGRPSTRVGRATVATGLAAAAGALALGASQLAWTGFARLVSSAEAGVVATPPHGALPAGPPRTLGAGAVALAIGAVAYGYARGYRRLRVRRHTVAVEGLPPALAGLRLLHVSDLHVGPLADRTLLRAALADAAALAPDLVCVTGDVVDNPYADLGTWLPELAALQAPLGVYAILGNHDLHAGAERVAAALAAATGWRVLRDEIAVVERAGARLHLIGLEHRRRGHAADALPAALARVPPGEPAVLLMHHPAAFPAAAAAGVALTLAGHTHGGQVAVPGLPWLNFARVGVTRFDAGLFSAGPATLHVSRGVGTSGQRLRLGVPNELALLTLVPAAAAAAA